MSTRHIASLLAAGMLAGCMASGPSVTAEAPRGAASSSAPLGSPFSDRRMGLGGSPLIIDRTDLRIGTTVEFGRLPTTSELHDATQTLGLNHVVLVLPGWPSDYAPLEVLNQTPTEADVIVILPGYPPSRAAAEAWNYVQARLRIVLLVTGPPPSNAVIGDLNTMRGLERVIAQMDVPSRSGFERLQRPLSFRKVVE